MKKLFISAVVAMIAVASQASYLFWQVNLSNLDTTDNINYTFNNHTVNGFRVVAVEGNSYNWGTYDNVTSVGYLSSQSESGYTSFGNSPAYVATVSNVQGNKVLVADLTDGLSNDSYTYYIEILGSQNDVIGVGTTGLSYANAHSEGRLVTTLSDIGTAPLATWTGGAYAAPEPTSGLLLLVGGALLALRRRKA